MVNINLLDLNTYSVLILIVLYFSIVIRKQKLSISNTFFIVLIFSTILILILEVLSWVFEGKIGVYSLKLNVTFNFIFFSLNPLVPIVWLNYIDYKIFNSLKRLKRRLFYSYFLILSIIMFLINIKTGLIYNISENNIYQRGPYLYIFIIYLFVILFSSIIPIMQNKQSLDFSLFTSYFFFTFFPVVGAILQIIFEGQLLIWNAVTIAIFGTYIVLELRNLSKDFLTGLASRRELDEWLKYRIRGSGTKLKFAVIMIDLDGFKKINDIYGHKEGDIALKIFSNIISPAFKKKDIIGRYGGDEFLVIIDTEYEYMVDKAITRLHESIDEFNNKSIKPYKLKFSAGGAFYDPEIHKDYKELINQADKKMYSVKRESKRGIK